VADAAKLNAKMAALAVTTLFIELTPFLNLRTVNSLEFLRWENLEVSKSPLLLALTHSKAPATYFFSDWADGAIKFMDNMTGL
jgi:hypothetical protein